MGERSMKECVEEQLTVLREAARLHTTCGFSLQTWYDDGADLKGLHANDDEETVTSITYAWGYLSGAADAEDVTVMAYLDSFGLSFDDDDDDDGAVGSATVTFDRQYPDFDAVCERVIRHDVERSASARVRPAAGKKPRKQPRRKAKRT